MSSATSSTIEKRPLKRARLGPPDFYPQDPKQKEDELCPEKLKAGYVNSPIPNEYDSAKTPKIDDRLDDFVSKVSNSLNGIFSKKQDLNTWQDRDKKKLGNKEITFWHASAKPKDKDLWFRDLAGNKPLTALAKRFPIFNKKDEIFTTLCEFNIPMCRAAWFIKMTAAYYTMQQESGKMKRKQQNDPCSDWTQNMTRFLKDLLSKLADYYTLNSQSIMNSDVDLGLKQWNYCSRLARFMFEEGLLERQEFLYWLLEVFCEKSFRVEYHGVLKLFLPFLLQFVEGITRSETLSRRMMHICSRKLYQLYIDLDSTSISNTNPGVNRVPSPQSCYNEYLQCGYHRHVVISVSALIHAVMLECPTALVWNFLGDGSVSGAGADSKHSYLCGSPLDSLPCAPSTLPIPDGPVHESIRNALRSAEKGIIRRSQAVEARWSSDKCQQSGLGTVVPSMLRTLEAFDKLRLDEYHSAVKNLYKQIFLSDCTDPEEGGDGTVIKLLCHWAVTAQRVGSHRALVVVRLLEKRKSDLDSESQADIDSGSNSYPFQQFLSEYLDTEAPSLKDENSAWNSEGFNLIFLYSEFIRADLFSHDQYLCSLISRGELNTTVPLCQQQRSKSGQKSSFESHDFSEVPEEPRVDLDKVLASITDDRPSVSGLDNSTPLSADSSAPGSVDIQPSSVESTSLEGLTTSTTSVTLPFGGVPPKPIVSLPSSSSLPVNSNVTTDGNSGKSEEKLSRHQLYVMHFPIPQDDQYRHECNQRQTLLFGVGAAREARKDVIKNLTKEVKRIWQKKYCIECLDGGIKLKKKLSFDSLNSLTKKFSLPMYDQHVVLGICADSFIDQLKDFTSRESQLLPTPESLDYLLKIMEMGAYIFGFIDFIDEVVELLPGVEMELRSKNCQLSGVYGFQLAFCFVGYLRRHFAYFILCQEEMDNIFNQLLILLEVTLSGAIGNQMVMSCWERVMDVFLQDMIQFCSDNSGRYSRLEERLKRALPTRVECPSVANGHYDKYFARQLPDSSKKKFDTSILERINKGDRESADRRYSFVVNSLLNVVSCGQDREKLAELCSFCADATTACPSLAAEWVGAFKALCYSSAAGGMNQDIGFNDLLVQIKVTDESVHGPIATFVMSLVARHCVYLEDLVLHVFSPSLFAPFRLTNTSVRIGSDMAAETRLSLTILAAVLCWTEDWTFVQARLTAERYLLCAALENFVAQGVFTVLIAMLLLADNDSISGTPETESTDGAFRNQEGSLQNFAGRVLTIVCSQEWICRKFLYQTELFTEKLLLNKKVKPEQAQKLLRLITRRSCEKGLVAELDNCGSKKNLIAKLLSSLNLWNIRVAMLELMLLLKQTSSSECSQIVEMIARSCMDLFHSHSAGGMGMVNLSTPSQQSSLPGAPAVQDRNHFCVADVSNNWLIAPLISRLPSNVQGKVLKAAASVLETGQIGRKEKGTGGLQQSAWLLGQQPFLCLVLTCLNGQEDQREGLLNSLLKQLQEYVHRAKEVGGMFETVCKAQNIETWSLLFLQLMVHNVVSIDTDSTLFHTCLDMLTVCIHSCLVPASCGSLAPERMPEECRKLNATVIKKLKREIADKYSPNSPSLRPVYQLLPIPKAQVDIITCEPYGAQPAPKVVKGAPQPPPPPLPSSSRQVDEEMIERYREGSSGSGHRQPMPHVPVIPPARLPGPIANTEMRPMRPQPVQQPPTMPGFSPHQPSPVPVMPQHPSPQIIMPPQMQHPVMLHQGSSKNYKNDALMSSRKSCERPKPQEFLTQPPEQPAPVSGRGGSKGKRKSSGGRGGGRKNSKGATTPPVANNLAQQMPQQRPPSGMSYAAGPSAYGTSVQPTAQWMGGAKYPMPNQQQPPPGTQSSREALRNLIGSRYAAPGPTAATSSGYPMNARNGANEAFPPNPPVTISSHFQQARMDHTQLRQQIVNQELEQQQNIVHRPTSLQRQESASGQMLLGQGYTVGSGQSVQISCSDGGLYGGRSQPHPMTAQTQPIYMAQDTSYPQSGQSQEQMMAMNRQRLMQQQGANVGSMNPRMVGPITSQHQMPVPYSQPYNSQRMPVQYSSATGGPMGQDQMFPVYQ